MKLLSPSMLYLALSLPVVILFYMLRMRRKDTVVSSIYLWQDLLQDIQASKPWQRLRFSILMLLQLFILFLLILALAAPAISKRAGKAENIVLVIDVSQSMGSKEKGGSKNGVSRLDMAKAKAKEIVSRATSTARISLITVSDNAQVATINSRDKSRIQNEIENLKPEGSNTSVNNALHLGTSIVGRLKDSEIYLLSDGCFKNIDSDLQAPVRFMRIGRSNTNIAIRTALLVENPNPPHNPELFVSVKNFSSTGHSVIVSVYSKDTKDIESTEGNNDTKDTKRTENAKSELIDSKRLSLDPQATESVIFSDGVAGLKEAEVKLACNDALQIDNKAEVVMPNRSLGSIVLVGSSNVFLEQGLRSVSSAKLNVISPTEWKREWEKTKGVVKSADIIVFDGFIPDVIPERNLIIINPPLAKGGLHAPHEFEASGKKKAASIETLDPNHPVLQFCDMSETKIASIKTVLLPEWMRVIASGKLADGYVDTGAAVIAAGENNGSRVVALCFDLLDSDLPLRVTFPILLANVIDYLNPASANKNKKIGPGFALADEATQPIPKSDANDAYIESDITPADHLELERVAIQKAGRDARTVDTELWPWIAAAVLLLLPAEGWAYVKGY